MKMMIWFHYGEPVKNANIKNLSIEDSFVQNVHVKSDIMKQLNREEAIALASSGEWKNWTYEKQAYFQLNQKRCCMDFSAFKKAVSKVLHRPVYTHEFVNSKQLLDEMEGKIPSPTLEDIIGQLEKYGKKIIVVTHESEGTDLE